MAALSLRRVVVGTRVSLAPLTAASTPRTCARAQSWRRCYAQAPTLLELVKQLRKETSAGIADCKDALVEAGHDVSKAKLILQEKAKKTAAKKASRQALEGVVLGAVSADATRAYLLELNCETDFAAKDANFGTAARDMAKALANAPDLLAPGAVSPDLDRARVLALPHGSSSVAGNAVQTVAQAVEQLSFLLRENVQLRRASALAVPANEAASGQRRLYVKVHGPLDSQQPALGRIAAAVEVTASVPLNAKQLPKLDELGAQLCLHVLAWKPRAVTPEQVAALPPLPTSDDDEKHPLAEDEVLEPALLKQGWLFDDKRTVAAVLTKFGKERLGGIDVAVTRFVRWELGEGMVRVEADLAGDVQKMLHKE